VERCGRKQQWRKFEYHPDICLGGGLLEETTEKPVTIFIYLIEILTGNPSNTSYDRYSLYQRRKLFVATLQFRLIPP